MDQARQRPRRTARHVWRRSREVLHRGREIVRNQGWIALAFTILGDLGYRRFLLFERSLDEPIVPVAASLPLAFEALRPAALEEYLRVHAIAPRPEIEERLARGDACCVARSGGRIVAVSWWSHDAHFFRSLGCRYAIPPAEVYLYDAFTDPGHRGRGVAPALGVHVLEHLRVMGMTRAVLAIAPENAANRRARAKTGFRPFMRIDYVRFGERQWHWHRAVDARGQSR